MGAIGVKNGRAQLSMHVIRTPYIACYISVVDNVHQQQGYTTSHNIHFTTLTYVCIHALPYHVHVYRALQGLRVGRLWTSKISPPLSPHNNPMYPHH